MYSLIFALWFFLPAGVANVTPIFAAHIPILKKFDYPCDFHRSLRGKRIFGGHKTIRGFVTGVALGTLTALMQGMIVSSLPVLPYMLPTSYLSTNMLVLGLLLSVGALSGDMLKSFFKRRAHIAAGSTWIPFDQIDYVLGALLLSLFVLRFSLVFYLTVLILWFGIHIGSTFLGYFLHLKDRPL